MSPRHLLIRSFTAVTILAAATAAAAHPALVSSTPADRAEGAAPLRVELRFSEDLTPSLSGASLLMTSMPGMAAHAPMKIPARISGTEDPKTMWIVPAQPLAAGGYRVDWRAVSADTHPITGSISFNVK